MAVRPSARTTARRAAERDLLDAASEQVRRRSRGRCEVNAPPCTTWATDTPHHRRLRSQGGEHHPDNLFDTCAPCHRYVHEHPAESYARGWLLRGVAP